MVALRGSQGCWGGCRGEGDRELENWGIGGRGKWWGR